MNIFKAQLLGWEVLFDKQQSWRQKLLEICENNGFDES